MSTVQHIWSPLLHWVPPPFQIGIALLITLLLISKVLPRLINALGAVLRAVWTPLSSCSRTPSSWSPAGCGAADASPRRASTPTAGCSGPSSHPAPGSASGSPPAGPPAGPASRGRPQSWSSRCWPGAGTPHQGCRRAEDAARQYQHRRHAHQYLDRHRKVGDRPPAACTVVKGKAAKAKGGKEEPAKKKALRPAAGYLGIQRPLIVGRGSRAKEVTQQPVPLRRSAPRPYDLRHAAVSLWLNPCVPATEVARRAGARRRDPAEDLRALHRRAGGRRAQAD